jgi:hypothetical protein
MSREGAGVILFDINGNPVQLGIPVSPDPTLSIVQRLVDGTDPNMAVDGTTPKTYTISADPTKDLFLVDMQIMIVASTLTFGLSKFAGMDALTNGVKVEVTVNNGTLSELGLLKQNEDMMFFSTAGGWDLVIANKDIIRSTYTFGGVMKLAAGTADKAEITIQDNLSLGISYFQAQLRMIKEA